jgi:hypothetical protein
MSLPRTLVSDSFKTLRPFTDNGVVSCCRRKHHKLSGQFKGRKWVFMIPCTPQPHCIQKLLQIKLSRLLKTLSRYELDPAFS